MKWKLLIRVWLCDPMDYTVHGILQARTLELVAFPSSRGSSQPRDRTQVSHTADRFFTSSATREAHILTIAKLKHVMIDDIEHLRKQGNLSEVIRGFPFLSYIFMATLVRMMSANLTSHWYKFFSPYFMSELMTSFSLCWLSQARTQQK